MRSKYDQNCNKWQYIKFLESCEYINIIQPYSVWNIVYLLWNTILIFIYFVFHPLFLRLSIHRTKFCLTLTVKIDNWIYYNLSKSLTTRLVIFLLKYVVCSSSHKTVFIFNRLNSQSKIVPLRFHSATFVRLGK